MPKKAYTDIDAHWDIRKDIGTPLDIKDVIRQYLASQKQ